MAFGLGQALVAAGLLTEVTRLAIPQGPPGVRELFEEVGRSVGVDPDILHAIAWQETNVNPDTRRGASGEVGMMQVIPGDVRGRPPGVGWTAAELSTIDGNVRAAATLWVAHRRIVGDSITKGFDAYNGGVDLERRDVRVGASNDRYVFEAFARYVALKVAAAAPSHFIRKG